MGGSLGTFWVGGGGAREKFLEGRWRLREAQRVVEGLEKESAGMTMV